MASNQGHLMLAEFAAPGNGKVDAEAPALAR
jgi:hypothetical protein